ncbi:MAG: hypothetical protein WC364_15240 [Eubacteriales bacterium]
MKTVSMWSFSGGNREISIHDVDPELFEKLRPVFDKRENPPVESIGRITFDEDTSILLFMKTNDEQLKPIQEEIL